MYQEVYGLAVSSVAKMTISWLSPSACSKKAKAALDVYKRQGYTIIWWSIPLGWLLADVAGFGVWAVRKPLEQKK